VIRPFFGFLSSIKKIKIIFNILLHLPRLKKPWFNQNWRGLQQNLTRSMNNNKLFINEKMAH